MKSSKSLFLQAVGEILVPTLNLPDQRPSVSIAHVVLETDRMDESAQFMRTIGMRQIFQGAEVSIYELRGGTHLILMFKEQISVGTAPFDLMVDDLSATHQQMTALGLAPSTIESKPAVNHSVFTVREPAGHVISVYSSHVSGAPV